MAATAQSAIAVIGIAGLEGRGAIVLRQKWSRGQVEARFANMSARFISDTQNEKKCPDPGRGP
jgi:hypothetical protein